MNSYEYKSVWLSPRRLMQRDISIKSSKDHNKDQGKEPEHNSN